MPHLSVLMPVKDGERYLRRAVSSTLRALPDDANLVVLDDGSTDGTAEILDALAEPRLVVHRNSESQGIARGLNALIERTDSEFVARMDADDVVLPWRFRRQLKLAERSDLVFTSLVFMNEDGRPVRPDLPGSIGPESAPLHLVLASCFSHPTALARRSALPAGAYRELAAEDYDLWLRFAAEGRSIARDRVPGIMYRRHTGQISSSSEWLDRRAEELAAGGLIDSYRAVLGRLGLPTDVPIGALMFAMSMIPPTEASDTEWLSELHRAVGAQTPRLSPAERATLSSRLRSLRKRCESNGPVSAPR